MNCSKWLCGISQEFLLIHRHPPLCGPPQTEDTLRPVALPPKAMSFLLGHKYRRPPPPTSKVVHPQSHSAWPRNHLVNPNSRGIIDKSISMATTCPRNKREDMLQNTLVGNISSSSLPPTKSPPGLCPTVLAHCPQEFPRIHTQRLVL